MWDESISKLKELIADDYPAARILSDPCHLELREWISNEFPVSQLIVKSGQAAELLEKAPGTYVTVMTGLLDQTADVDNMTTCLVEPLRELLASFFGGKLLICGIGNQEQVTDSLGPETVRRLPLKAMEALKVKSKFAGMAAVCPGVEWNTNLDTATVIAGVASSVGADCVLLIDAMACDNCDRLCATIQLSNTGMSGYNAPKKLDRQTIGVPTVSIGVPTVLRMDAFCQEYTSDTMFTVSHISAVIKTAAYAIAAAVLQAVCPELDGPSAKSLVEHNLIW